jgi:hypothetical protein
LVPGVIGGVVDWARAGTAIMLASRLMVSRRDFDIGFLQGGEG